MNRNYATPVHEFFFFLIVVAIAVAAFTDAGLWPLAGILGAAYYIRKFLNGLNNEGPPSGRR